MEQYSADALAQDIVSYVTSISAHKDAKDMKALIQSLEEAQAAKNYLGLTEQIVASQDLLFHEEFSTDTEGCFKLCIALANQLEDATSFYQNYFQSILNTTTSFTKLRLRITADAFNMIPQECVEVRFSGLLQVLKYAAKAGEHRMIQNQMLSVEKLFNASQLTIGQLRKLYLVLIQCLQTNDQQDNEIEQLGYISKYLRTFQQVSDTKELSEASAIAIQGMVMVIRSPIASFTAGIDLADLVAIKHLKTTGSAQHLVALLDIFSSQTLTEYLAFSKAHMDVLKEYKLDHELCVSNIRLLSICSFSESSNQEIPYQTITDTLQIEADQVEVWVVKAITSNLIQAKIDQLRQVVLISRSLSRKFDTKEWAQLGSKLKLWKTNIHALLETIQTSRGELMAKRV